MTSLKLQFENEIRRVTFAAPLSAVRDVQARAQALFPALAAHATDAIRFTYVDADGDTITVGCDGDLAEAIGHATKLTVVVPPIVATTDKKTGVETKDQQEEKKVDEKIAASASIANPIGAVFDAIKADAHVQELARSFGISLDASFPDIIAQVRASPLVASLIPPPIGDDNESDEDGEVAPVVHNATCDGCHMRIVGLRFKCAACPDFDFCEKCFAGKGQSHPTNHMFVKIAEAAHPRCGAHCQRGVAPGFCKPAQAAPAAPAEPVPQYELEHVAQAGAVSLAPGQQFVKLVKIKNVSGELIKQAALVQVSGPRVGNARVPIGDIGAGEERFVAIDVEAPLDAAGEHLISVYRLTRQPKGLVQGEPVVVELRVE